MVLASDDEYEQAEDGTRIKREQSDIIQQGLLQSTAGMTSAQIAMVIEALSDNLTSENGHNPTVLTVNSKTYTVATMR